MDLKLDTTHDLDVTAGQLTLLDGIDAIAQSCTIRLQFFQGEWFLDQRLGVPWFQRILGQKPRLNAVSNILQKAITLTPGILAITGFEMDFDLPTRTLSITFTAETTEGHLDYTTELIIP